ncbi:hypothetical protein AX769_20085 [Frondihabitans sp. PAMC 28766]|uniref:glycosyltransferase n=1 Tax=Frondihabitans sp. PAMC 28766 TaxID=1795630 RepID=UPI00078BDF59|nr:glycosyltransferase family 2 protein [Frondihabitans sp. PAMC 28766]AMM22026.1 hypothetical protein AX769_20085 [Frondihabitans sp. PAMC 28766]
MPSVSVVVCTMVAREDDLRQLLTGLARQQYEGEHEFILVDNRVVDPEFDILPGLLEPYPHIRVVHQRKAGIAAARNAGLAAARYDVVAYTDDDVRVDDNWLRVIGERFSRRDRIDVMTGMILPAELETPAQFWFERYYGGFSGERLFAPALLRAVDDVPRLIRGSRIAAYGADGFESARFAVYGVGAYGAGANMSYRRESLIAAGGFDNALGTGTPALGGEDLATLMTMLWRGDKLAFEPGAVVHHRHRQSLRELESQLHGYGLGFTALLFALTAADPRHLLGLGWQVPLASVTMVKQTIGRVVTRSRGTAGPQQTAVEQALDTGYPASLVFDELSGYPKGPLAYLRSRRWWKSTQALKAAPEVVREGTSVGARA